MPLQGRYQSPSAPCGQTRPDNPCFLGYHQNSVEKGLVPAPVWGLAQVLVRGLAPVLQKAVSSFSDTLVLLSS